MTNKRRLPFLALALVAASHAAPQYEANPIRLSNDFVFRALAKETKGNVAIAPGGPLAALAALGAAENPLPELAQQRLGGSSEAAEKLLKTLGKAEQGLNQTVILRHSRSAWLTEPVGIEPSVVAVHPASESAPGLRAFLAQAALPKEEKKEATKPAGLASISSFEALDARTLNPLPKEMSIRFEGRPVDSVSAVGNGYFADDIAETVVVPIASQSNHVLVLTLPKDGAKLNDLMVEIGSRVEQIMGAEEQLAYVQFPRIATATDLDAAEPLGLGKANVTAETRTFVTIGGKYVPPKGGVRGGAGGGGISMRIWRPMPMPAMGGANLNRNGKNAKAKEIPNVRIDRPFTYAVVERKSRTIVLAGIVRELEANGK